jgi:hypothetical protein
MAKVHLAGGHRMHNRAALAFVPVSCLLACFLLPIGKVRGVDGKEADANSAASKPAAASRESPGLSPKSPATQPGAEEIATLIARLGGEKPRDREAAHAALVRIGKPAMEALRAASADKDVERSQRAKTVLAEITAALRRKSHFAIYVVIEPGLMEVDKVELAALKLSDNPALCDEDIADYDWDKHVIRLAAGGGANLPDSHHTLNTPFVVVADGNRCYVGDFRTMISSYIGRLPSIELGWLDEPETKNKLGIGIPIVGAPDPRSDPRIRKALDAAGKLKAPASRSAKEPALK